MKKTIIIFAGADLNGSTAKLMNRFIKKLKSKMVYTLECDTLNLDHTIQNRQLKKRIMMSDDIIIFTPTYWFGIPSRLQVLIEMLTVIEENKFNFMEGKRFACVSYSPHGGDTENITKLGLIFNGWGCEIVPCGLLYFRSLTKFQKDVHWTFQDLDNLAQKFNLTK